MSLCVCAAYVGCRRLVDVSALAGNDDDGEPYLCNVKFISLAQEQTLRTLMWQALLQQRREICVCFCVCLCVRSFARCHSVLPRRQSKRPRQAQKPQKRLFVQSLPRRSQKLANKRPKKRPQSQSSAQLQSECPQSGDVQ